MELLHGGHPANRATRLIAPADTHTWVYTALCSHGSPLYIGVTGNPSRRMTQHRLSKPWWNSDVWAVTASLYQTRDLALLVETESIKHYNPHWNRAGRNHWLMVDEELGIPSIGSRCFTPDGLAL